VKTSHKKKYLEEVFSYLETPLLEKTKTGTKKQKIIVIAGPTAVGKTKLSIDIAAAIGGEIISCDSMQVYKDMDIGTAKATKEEQKEIKHHMIDVADVKKSFNVVDYYNLSHKICREILSRGKVPIVVGGSGFYMHCFIYGPPYGPPSVVEVRKNIEELVELHGIEAMYERLQMLDPDYAKTISDKDRHKIIRALEIISITKKRVSDLPKSDSLNDIYDFRCWFLHIDKKYLYEKIEKRCEKMLKIGFIDEIIKLEKDGLLKNHSASNAIGYQQGIEYLKSEKSATDYEKFKKEFIRVSKRYVKRQYTWFKREKIFRFIDVLENNNQKVIEYILQDYEQGN
jgi:tRNA dimethylallyltransferase